MIRIRPLPFGWCALVEGVEGPASAARRERPSEVVRANWSVYRMSSVSTASELVWLDARARWRGHLGVVRVSS